MRSIGRLNKAFSIRPADPAPSCFTRSVISSQRGRGHRVRHRTQWRAKQPPLIAGTRHPSGRRHHRPRDLSFGTGAGPAGPQGRNLDSGLSRGRPAACPSPIPWRMKELTVDGAARPPTAKGATKLNFPEPFCRAPILFDKAVEALRSGSESKLARSQVEARLTQIGREHLQARADQGRNRSRHRSRRDVCGVRPAAQSRPRFGVDLCGAKPVASAVALICQRLGQCGGGQSAVGFVSPYEPGAAKAVSRHVQGRTGLCRCKIRRRKAICARCLPCARCRSICVPAAGLPSCCHWRRSRVASSKSCGPVRSPVRVLPGTKCGRWTTACNRCFRCRPAWCSAAGGPPRSHFRMLCERTLEFYLFGRT